MNTKMIDFLKEYKHSLFILYFPLYMIWFAWLERREASHFFVMECAADHMIPFCEFFAIPYFLWFLYVVAVLAFFFTQTKHLNDFYRCATILMLGMTTCLIVYTFLPNSQPLRPQSFPRNNVLTRMVAVLYRGDTPTNVCPSIHVYNSIAIHIALAKSHYFQNKQGWKAASLTLCILICLSTVFLKQHSVIDMACAILLYLVFYCIVYHPWKKGAAAQAR